MGVTTRPLPPTQASLSPGSLLLGSVSVQASCSARAGGQALPFLVPRSVLCLDLTPGTHRPRHTRPHTWHAPAGRCRRRPQPPPLTRRLRATMSGVSLWQFLRPLSAPLRTSVRTSGRSPRPDAECSAELPEYIWAFTLAPCCGRERGSAPRGGRGHGRGGGGGWGLMAGGT